MKYIFLTLVLSVFSSSILFAQNSELPTWHLSVIGKPYMKKIEVMKKVAKKWEIPLEVEFFGCDASQAETKEYKKNAALNKIAFKKYAEVFGEDWRDRFNKEVDEKMK